MKESEHPIELRSRSFKEKPLMEFPVTYIDVEKLHPHEEVIAHEYQHVVDSLKRDKVLRTPILVSEQYVILDGHHRFAALRSMDAKKIPAIVVDYYDESLVEVGTWYPIVPLPLQQVLDAFREEGLEPQRTQDNFVQELNERRVAAVIANKQESYAVSGEREDCFRIVRDRWLEGTRYADEPELAIKNTDGEHTAIISWAYTKDEIQEHAMSGKVFLPKTTRHTLKYQFPVYRIPVDEIL